MRRDTAELVLTWAVIVIIAFLAGCAVAYLVQVTSSWEQPEWWPRLHQNGREASETY